jgi:2-dehydropantoate 2-reductase
LGVIRSVPETRALLEQAMIEIRVLAHARGVQLPDDVVEQALALADQQPAAGTTSLQRDLAAGRRSELEWWSGSVVRLGLESGRADAAAPIHLSQPLAERASRIGPPGVPCRQLSQHRIPPLSGRNAI